MSSIDRGYYGIGIVGSKTPANVGTLWRSAAIYNAAFIFTIGHRYPHQSSDTLKTWKHTPLWRFDTFDEFIDGGPKGAPFVAVEQTEDARPLGRFHHPERAIYILGAEDGGVPRAVLARCHHVIEIPTPREFCMNVAVAGSIVMHDRWMQRRTEAASAAVPLPTTEGTPSAPSLDSTRRASSSPSSCSP